MVVVAWRLMDPQLARTLLECPVVHCSHYIEGLRLGQVGHGMEV